MEDNENMRDCLSS